jgi:hypothetical protein
MAESRDSIDFANIFSVGTGFARPSVMQNHLTELKYCGQVYVLRKPTSLLSLLSVSIPLNVPIQTLRL